MVDQTKMYPSSISPLGLFQGIGIGIIYRGLGFLKNHRRGDQDFFVKMKGSPYGRIVYRKGSKHYFSLVMYGFCSSNTLYSASVSFRMFIIISD